MNVTPNHVETLFKHWPALRRRLAAAPAPRTEARAMPQGETWGIAAAQGGHIECLEGRLWITQGCNSADHVLEAGERWAMPGDDCGDVLVHALRDARVHVLAWT